MRYYIMFIIGYIRTRNSLIAATIVAKGILTAKNEMQGRLMSEEHSLITTQDESLLPGESLPMNYFFYEQYLEEIKYYAFLATFVEYDQESASK